MDDAGRASAPAVVTVTASAAAPTPPLPPPPPPPPPSQLPATAAATDEPSHDPAVLYGGLDFSCAFYPARLIGRSVELGFGGD